MNFSFYFRLPPYLILVIVFFMIFLFGWLGFRYKKRQLIKHGGNTGESMGSIEGSMLGVMSLLLGFTFSVALSKFETRRNLIVEESNIIHTAILRCDLYPDSLRNTFLADFKEYVEARIAYYKVGDDVNKIEEEFKSGAKISARIWKRITLIANEPEFRIRSQQMIITLNSMIEIAVSREASRISRVPALILWTLMVLILTAAFLLGSDYKGQKRNISLLIGYAMTMSLSLNLINELNRPRQGLINLDEVEKKIEDLRMLVP